MRFSRELEPCTLFSECRLILQLVPLNLELIFMSLQLNVQQQNGIAKAEIIHASESFRQGAKHIAWLGNYLQSQGIDPSNGVLTRLTTTPDQAGELVRGVWLTAKQDFWEFDALMDRNSWQLIEVERFENVTDSITIDSNLKGVGKSFGCLALEVLHESLEN